MAFVSTIPGWWPRSVRSTPRARLGEHSALALAAAVLAAARAVALSVEQLQEALSQASGAQRAREVPAPAARFLAARLTHASPAQPGVAAQPAPAMPAMPIEFAQRDAAPQAFAIMASNAGLVLLHPFLPRLFEAASRHGVRITSVDIQEPNLETVFLHLTGRALRD